MDRQPEKQLKVAPTSRWPPPTPLSVRSRAVTGTSTNATSWHSGSAVNLVGCGNHTFCNSGNLCDDGNGEKQQQWRRYLHDTEIIVVVEDSEADDETDDVVDSPEDAEADDETEDCVVDSPEDTEADDETDNIDTQDDYGVFADTQEATKLGDYGVFVDTQEATKLGDFDLFADTQDATETQLCDYDLFNADTQVDANVPECGDEDPNSKISEETTFCDSDKTACAQFDPETQAAKLNEKPSSEHQTSSEPCNLPPASSWARRLKWKAGTFSLALDTPRETGLETAATPTRLDERDGGSHLPPAAPTGSDEGKGGNDLCPDSQYDIYGRWMDSQYDFYGRRMGRSPSPPPLPIKRYRYGDYVLSGRRLRGGGFEVEKWISGPGL